ncbi:MAG: hypothetical protein SPH68_07090 [Candidatus Borkfalkiaceae bacterium]|nr:TetR/AcrR family transcriptional regulator [Clostridia bacterium]MDY6223904.1 hypothetical protein [Christensenellaceae bacterium]
MDKRIVKTKRNIKETFIKLLNAKAFEKISVTELCEKGCVGRITFYTYYDDKYALVDEMMDDYMQEALDNYHRLQKEKNPANNPFEGYLNMLSATLDLYFSHVDFFSHAQIETNPYLYTSFYNRVFENACLYVQHHHAGMNPRYSARRTTILLCNGFWGIVSDATAEKKDFERTKKEIFDMYRAVLSSDLFCR